LGSSVPAVLHGFFSPSSGSRIGVYGVAGKLFLLIDDRLVELASRDTIDVCGPMEARRLRVLNGAGEPIAEATYSIPELARPSAGDPTPFISAEDFDIGLLASNVSKDPARRTVFTNR
jgi:hypothetical protein